MPKATITKACPKCGVNTPLVERINRTTGESFLGCTRYPTCTYTEPLPEAIRLKRMGQQDLQLRNVHL
jgi:ssDNA-binding Zn-finger/Zn-ribbon topoisomerase 1